MELLENLIKPEIIGPMIGGLGISAIKLHFNHVERIEKIRAGIDPDAE